MNDPAVLMMDECEVGAYTLLLCAIWDLEEPGVVPDDDRVLSRLSRTGERWSRYRERIAKAFDTKSRPGFWVQRRMIRTKLEQDRYTRTKSVQGKIGGIKSGETRRNKRSEIEANAKRNEAGSVSGSVTERIEKKETPSAVRPRKDRSAEPEGFSAFYAAFPRREDRRDSAKAYRQARERWPDWDADDFVAAAQGYGRDVRDRERKFIKQPASWLNADAHLDQLAETQNGTSGYQERRTNPEGRAAVQALVLGVLERTGGVG